MEQDHSAAHERRSLARRSLLACVVALAACSCTSTVTVKYAPLAGTHAGEKRKIAFVMRADAARTDHAARKLESYLVDQATKFPDIVVLERRHIDAALNEAALSLSAIVDESSALRVGKLLAADAIVLVELTSVQVRNQRHEMQHYFDGHANASAKAIDVETGQILSAAREAAQVSLLSRYATQAEAQDLLLRKLAEKFAASLRPDVKPLKLTLQNAPQEQIRTGVRFAQEGLWEEAVEAWTELLAAQPDHAVAHYDLGIVMAAMGQRDDARLHLERAAKLCPSERLYLRAYAAAKRSP